MRWARYPSPQATSRTESSRPELPPATVLSRLRTVGTPPNQRLNQRRSRNDRATSTGVPASESSSSVVDRRFMRNGFYRDGPRGLVIRLSDSGYRIIDRPPDLRVLDFRQFLFEQLLVI